MKILELFSGIGGMHYALEAGRVEAEVWAVEINNFANEVYHFNFPETKLIQTNILSLKAEAINNYAPEMLLMSPPCQPFTRVGLKKDLEDARTDPLKHILDLLCDLTSLKYILVENVKGFETSEARKALVNRLESLNYSIRELLISPIQLGVPNMRTRYYLLAKKHPMKFTFDCSNVLTELPDDGVKILSDLQQNFPAIQTIEDILETNAVNSEIFQDHLIPDTLLKSKVRVMDIVTSDDNRSCCFTKAYGSYAKGTGSVFCSYDQTRLGVLDQEPLDFLAVKELKLRYFTAREVARLMSFPETFTFPSHVTRKQKYRLLGNSINIKVVAVLIKLLLTDAQMGS